MTTETWQCNLTCMNCGRDWNHTVQRGFLVKEKMNFGIILVDENNEDNRDYCEDLECPNCGCKSMIKKR